MSLCFIIALCMVLAENNMQLRFHSLSTEAKKEMFARRNVQFIRDVWMFNQRIIQAFLVGIIIMGPVKLWQWVSTSVPICGSLEYTGISIPATCQLVATAAAFD